MNITIIQVYAIQSSHVNDNGRILLKYFENYCEFSEKILPNSLVRLDCQVRLLLIHIID